MAGSGTESATQTSGAIPLYPSNWLYNAGVIGFLREVQELTQENIDKFLDPQDTKILLRSQWIQECAKEYKRLHFDKNKEKEKDKAWLRIVGKNTYHKNYWQTTGEWKKTEKFQSFLYQLSDFQKLERTECSLCSRGYSIPASMVKDALIDKFLKDISHFESRIFSELGGAPKAFPNGFWNCKSNLPICHLCGYLLLFLLSGFTPPPTEETSVPSRSIFINAPSFPMMWHLNQYARSVFHRSQDVRQILGLSLIEFTIRQQVTLHRWALQNIEIVVRARGSLEFIQLPAETVQVLTNRRVAQQLNRIGELKILQLVLENKIDQLLEIGQALLRVAMKDKIEDAEKKFIKKVLPYRAPKDQLTEPDRRERLVEIAYQILTLNAMVREAINGE